MLAIFLRGDGGMSGYALRGASRAHEQPQRRMGALVQGSALILALLLAGSRAAWRVLMVLCEQTGRAAPTLLLGALLLGGFQVAQQLLRQNDPPLMPVYLAAEQADIDHKQLEQRLTPLLAHSGFFALDLDAVQQELESLPLIAAANLRKIWPGQLVVQLRMHQPQFRWKDAGLLVENGQRLSVQTEHYAHLPQLVGPVGSEAQLMQQYQQFAQMLRPLGLSVTRLEKRERGSGFLTATPKNGETAIEFALGRGNWQEKIQGFIYLVGREGLHLDELARVDLRHRNGFAVALIQPSEQGSEP